MTLQALHSSKLWVPPSPSPLGHIRLSLCLAALLQSNHHHFLATYALRCASFTPVNRGTSGRSACSSLGYEEHQSVVVSNMLAVRNLQCIWTFETCTHWLCGFARCSDFIWLYGGSVHNTESRGLTTIMHGVPSD